MARRAPPGEDFTIPIFLRNWPEHVLRSSDIVSIRNY